MRASRQYQFLCLLKWQAHAVHAERASGALSVLCPACPQPGINMNPEWMERPREDWYVLIIVMDLQN